MGLYMVLMDEFGRGVAQSGRVLGWAERSLVRIQSPRPKSFKARLIRYCFRVTKNCLSITADRKLMQKLDDDLIFVFIGTENYHFMIKRNIELLEEDLPTLAQWLYTTGVTQMAHQALPISKKCRGYQLV